MTRQRTPTLRRSCACSAESVHSGALVRVRQERHVGSGGMPSLPFIPSRFLKRRYPGIDLWRLVVAWRARRTPGGFGVISDYVALKESFTSFFVNSQTYRENCGCKLSESMLKPEMDPSTAPLACLAQCFSIGACLNIAINA